MNFINTYILYVTILKGKKLEKVFYIISIIREYDEIYTYTYVIGASINFWRIYIINVCVRIL